MTRCRCGLAATPEARWQRTGKPAELSPKLLIERPKHVGVVPKLQSNYVICVRPPITIFRNQPKIFHFEHTIIQARPRNNPNPTTRSKTRQGRWHGHGQELASPGSLSRSHSKQEPRSTFWKCKVQKPPPLPLLSLSKGVHWKTKYCFSAYWLMICLVGFFSVVWIQNWNPWSRAVMFKYSMFAALPPAEKAAIGFKS